MHSYRATKGTSFTFNSDFSGAVYIHVNNSQNEFAGEARVPGEDLLEFVAYCYVASKKVREIEDAEWKDLL